MPQYICTPLKIRLPLEWIAFSSATAASTEPTPVRRIPGSISMMTLSGRSRTCGGERSDVRGIVDGDHEIRDASVERDQPLDSRC